MEPEKNQKTDAPTIPMSIFHFSPGSIDASLRLKRERRQDAEGRSP
jgi:hypothetical protein